MNPSPAPSSVAAEFWLLAALWGASFLFMQTAVADFGPWATALGRVSVASLVLLPLLFQRGLWIQLRQNAGGVLVVGVLNAGLPFALYSYALQSLNTGLTAILNATSPLFGALVAWVWLKERPARWPALGLCIGFVGVALLSWEQASFRPGGSGWAVLACLGATLSYGIAASFTRKHLTGVPAMVTATGTQLGASLTLVLPALWFSPSHWPGLKAWGAVLAAGLLCTALAYVLFYRLIERTGPSKTLTVTFLIPVFALLYGALLLKEPITLHMLAGGAVVLLGVALATGWWTPRWGHPVPRP